jgi:heme-degrading monooxygenase HmoA
VKLHEQYSCIGRARGSTVSKPLWALKLWKDGPLAGTDAEVLISITDFTAHRWRDLPSIYWQALRLRWGWSGMRGAVGLWVWTKPLRKRSGSVSVWRSRDDLKAFVATPYHVAVMRRNRGRGTLVAHRGMESAYSRERVWQQAAVQLADASNPS